MVNIIVRYLYINIIFILQSISLKDSTLLVNKDNYNECLIYQIYYFIYWNSIFPPPTYNTTVYFHQLRNLETLDHSGNIRQNYIRAFKV